MKFFSASSTDNITNKRGFLFFTWRGIKLPERKKGMRKKPAHGHEDRHTICDSFLLLFGFRSRPFWRADYDLLCVCACEFVLSILTIIWMYIRKFRCICQLLIVKIKFPTLWRVLFCTQRAPSIYRQEHSPQCPWLRRNETNRNKLASWLGQRAPHWFPSAQALHIYTRIKHTRIKSRQIRWQGKNPLRTCTEKYKTMLCYSWVIRKQQKNQRKKKQLTHTHTKETFTARKIIWEREREKKHDEIERNEQKQTNLTHTGIHENEAEATVEVKYKNH